MSPWRIGIDARVVIAQETGGRDGHFAACEFVTDVRVYMTASRLPALSLAHTGVRLSQQLAVDVKCKTLAGTNVVASPNHDPIAIALFQRRVLERASDEQDFLFPQ